MREEDKKYFYGADGKVDVQRVLLETVKIAGLLSMSLLAPNALKSLTLLDGGKIKRNRRPYIDRTIEKLEVKKLVKVVYKSNGSKFVTLTKLGDDLLDRYEISDLVISKPKKWDGKYRLVIFDIKEGKRKIRDDLRRWLEQLGFFKLQNSVWIYPYECREVVILLKSRLGVGAEVLYLTVDSVEDGYKLKNIFSL